MGIGTKIKDALNPDRHNQYDNTTTDTTKTPGSFPSEEVPRTHGVHDSTFGSTTDPKAEKLAGRHSPEYTYGHSGTNATSTDTQGHSKIRHEEPLTGTAGTAGTTGTHGAHGNNKLSKGHKEPYWGDAEQSNSNEFGTTTTGAYDRQGKNLNATEVNDRYNSPYTQDDFAHGGNTTGRSAAGNDNFGQTGTSGRDHIGQETSHTGGAVASNLTHRPHDTSNIARDYKTDEYDAPTNSSGRGRTAGAAGAGAAAGYGASELSNLHHEHDMREYNAAGANRHGGRNNDNFGTQDGVPATSSRVDPYNQHSNQSTAPTGSSMLDPYDKQSTTSTGHGIMHHHDKHTTAAGPNTVDAVHSRHSPRDAGFVPGTDRSSIGSSSYGQTGPGSQGIQGAQSTSMGDDHFGPGHAGAKVHHQCHNCGADNDITKYFRKDAVYRMS